jgi:amino acid permease
MMYNHPFTSVPFQVPIFPLAIVYSILFFILFCVLYILSMFIKVKWLLWYIGLASFSCIVLIFEFFSGKYDIFKDHTPLNLNQFFSCILVWICGYKIYELLELKNKKK